MSYINVIQHIQDVLNSCGDPVRLEPTGHFTKSASGKLSIEIKKVAIKEMNNCGDVTRPEPECDDKPPLGYFYVNRIRLSHKIIDNYSKGFPWHDYEIKNLLTPPSDLFGCY